MTTLPYHTGVNFMLINHSCISKNTAIPLLGTAPSAFRFPLSVIEAVYGVAQTILCCPCGWVCPNKMDNPYLEGKAHAFMGTYSAIESLINVCMLGFFATMQYDNSNPEEELLDTGQLLNYGLSIIYKDQPRATTNGPRQDPMSLG